MHALFVNAVHSLSRIAWIEMEEHSGSALR